MLCADSHTHSLCSPDGKYPMTELCRAAVENGLTHLTITDHCDLVDLHGTLTLDFDWAPYNAAMEEALAQLPPGLTLLKGLELGEAPEDPAAARAILTQGPQLDFVLGSIHNSTEKFGREDLYYAEYTTTEGCYATLEDYFDSLEKLVSMPDCFDSLAHIVFPIRYMNGRGGQNISLTEGPFRPRLEALFRALVRQDKALELNTWRGRTVAEWEPFLRLFKSLGGKYVTVGSDSHTTAQLGYGVRESYALLKACGFDSVTVYRRRTPQLFPI